MEKTKQLRASGEDYLEAILMIKNKKGYVRSIDVAKHLNFTKPSVSHAISLLRDGGFVYVDNDGFLELTDIGKEIAEKVFEKHCYLKSALESIGVDEKTAEDEACSIEHLISEDTFDKMKKNLTIKKDTNQ